MTVPTSEEPSLGPGPIELGPNLPMAAYHATERWHSERIGALALYCSDGRWGEAFDEFCHRHLLIPRYDRWAVPGGPAWLAGCPGDEALLETARTQLDFLVRVHELEKFVLITHYGCAWYGHRLGRPAEECLAAQLADLRAAAAALRNWHPRLEVDGYLAVREQEWLSFHEFDVGGRTEASIPRCLGEPSFPTVSAVGAKQHGRGGFAAPAGTIHPDAVTSGRSFSVVRWPRGPH